MRHNQCRSKDWTDEEELQPSIVLGNWRVALITLALDGTELSNSIYL